MAPVVLCRIGQWHHYRSMSDLSQPVNILAPTGPELGWFKTPAAPRTVATLYIGDDVALPPAIHLGLVRQAESESLTGLELLRNKDPELRGDVTDDDAREIRESVSKHSNAAVFIVVSCLAAFVVAVVVGQLRESFISALVLQVASLIALASTGLFIAVDFELFGVEVHHKAGFVLLPPLALLQVLLSYNILAQRWRKERQLSRVDLALPVAVLGLATQFPPLPG